MESESNEKQRLSVTLSRHQIISQTHSTNTFHKHIPHIPRFLKHIPRNSHKNNRDPHEQEWHLPLCLCFVLLYMVLFKTKLPVGALLIEAGDCLVGCHDSFDSMHFLLQLFCRPSKPNMMLLVFLHSSMLLGLVSGNTVLSVLVFTCRLCFKLEGRAFCLVLTTTGDVFIRGGDGGCCGGCCRLGEPLARLGCFILGGVG
jgi:hypothetical protein